ncbi:flagellar export chaperone FlgN [Phaeobacter sp. 11ANDIMAR09]|uniref:flagellar export chaperone FlgN n=1 Tax=Phaeobacter sp. 11ANDIMAR09 TaxID=1225647 RepID=UPI0006C839AB|nr:flagellar export chaperone FlgN [Phaeobacter sp. 11ANDIMAR09]KPD14302.1 flagellar biosynthesis protein FlgN [Phaeobacter sp. 11ANDIMAR09]OIQ34270.1 MAG: flagellar biosynthesis protein FlgN [Roseobacter sp. MedPE-SWchi]
MIDQNLQITHQNPQNLIDELDEILDQERSALVRGELDKIEELLARKETIIARLNTIDSLEREALAQVQTKVSRNQELLNSAMEGIRSVATRMAELRRVKKGLDVYDRAGRKARYGTTMGQRLEKRS